MARPLGYGDAVKLLGGDPPALAALDRALGGALGVVTGGMSGVVLNVFDARGRILGLGRDLTGGLRDRLRGAGRVRRTRLLEAAHAVIVVTAYFEALGEVELPFDVRELELTGEDQARLALGAEAGRYLTELLSRSAPPRPAPHLPYERFIEELRRWYLNLSHRLLRYIAGLEVWDRLDDRERSVTTVLVDKLYEEAVDRYEEYYSRLSTDISEFALWTTRIEHQATREEARRALVRVETLLNSLSAAVSPGAVAEALSRTYRAALARPILTEGDTPDGVRLPTLEEGYFDPDFRIRVVVGEGQPADEDWWAETSVRSDLTDCLAGLLTSPEAQSGPLLVLGQPGAGKSVLTKVLAARLPTEAFLPVRVVLRGVPADAEIQDQIEYAIREDTGERVGWPDLARAAGGALPVILFDGFDELLQATGVSQSDYLERVARFQQREADQGRPVAALVTSRTAVADRARCPEDMVAIRLEPFRQEQIDAWVAVWNRHNEALLTGRGLAPLPAEVVVRQRTLASQPLLLLMLALYDADANALQRMGDSLDVTELYEELLASFARREVGKSAAGLPEVETDRLVELELQRLSLVAFGMVNRRRQWVTGAELDSDLAALLGTGRTATTTTFRAPLTQADATLGRFFFIQRAQAVREGTRLETYEFLHATFGEYLVARLAVGIAGEMLHQRPALALAPVSVDDDMLFALLSFAPLSSRQILQFVSGICTRRFALSPDRSRLADLLTGVLAERAMRPDVPRPDYRPAALPLSSRHGIYSANLVLLIVALAGRVTATYLFPEAADPVDAWHRRVLLWRSSLAEPDWSDLGLALQVEHVWAEDRRELRIRLTGRTRAPAEPVDPFWHYRYPPGHPNRIAGQVWTRSHWDEVWHRMAVSGGTNDSMIRHALTPVHTWIGPAMAIFRGNFEGPANSLAHDLLEMWLAGTLGASDEHLTVVYGRLLHFLMSSRQVDVEMRGKALALVLSRLGEDHARLPAELVDATLENALLFSSRARDLRRILGIALDAGKPAIVDEAVMDLEADPHPEDAPLLARAQAFLAARSGRRL